MSIHFYIKTALLLCFCFSGCGDSIAQSPSQKHLAGFRKRFEAAVKSGGMFAGMAAAQLEEIKGTIDVSIAGKPTTAVGTHNRFYPNSSLAMMKMAQSTVEIKNDSSFEVSSVTLRIRLANAATGDQYAIGSSQQIASIMPGRSATLTFDESSWPKHVTNSPTEQDMKNAQWKVCLMEVSTNEGRHATAQGEIDSQWVNPPREAGADMKIMDSMGKLKRKSPFSPGMKSLGEAAGPSLTPEQVLRADPFKVRK